MCKTRFWGSVGVIACGYFCYLSYSQLREGDFFWAHDVWSWLTYAVWIALILGLLTETRCWRERIFFGLVLANFSVGLVMSVWETASWDTVHKLRELSMAIWALAAAASLLTLSRPSEPEGRTQSS